MLATGPAARIAKAATESDGAATEGTATDGTATGDSSATTGDDDFVCGGCYGRPYIAEGRVRVAAIVDADAWRGPVGAPALDGLDEAQRAALADLWTTAARSEHSSIAGFHRLALDLLAHGAPPELVARAGKAALEELEHARACFGLASAYADRPIGAGPMPLGGSAPIASSLEELAVWTVHEGCVGETVAAWLAAELRERAEDPAVQAVLAAIADEEAEHAELAWAILRWSIDAGGEPVRRAVAEAFAAAQVTPPTHGHAPLPGHGMLADAAIADAVRLAFTEVVRPCAEALVAAA
ncbi:MAG: ferritin-like domain-containing protein [Nannocystaceae bacterium]